MTFRSLGRTEPWPGLLLSQNHLLFTIAGAVNLPLTARALQTGLSP